MLERDGYPPCVPCWIDTTQPDPQAGVRFYGELLGWSFEDRMPADAPGHYYMAQLRGRDVAAIGSRQDNASGTPAWNAYICGAVVGAADAVFGWEAQTVAFGELEGTMWRLPGYAEVLEAIEPGLRRRQAQQGAPAGFEDAIGWMLPMTRHQSAADIPSHWSVTFAVDDTDAIAVRTEQLGGTIIVAPYDVPPARIATLSDPQARSSRSTRSLRRRSPDSRGSTPPAPDAALSP